MEHVTDINLQVNGREVVYRVLFHDELYTFEPENDDTGKEEFSLRRTQNEWEPVDAPDAAVAKQATEKLEAFLLSQH